MKPLDFETANALFSYDEITGFLIWRARANDTRCHRSWNTRFVGKPVGNIGTKGYVEFRLSRVSYKAHRVIWLIKTGEWPKGEVDHINGDRSDNRFSNLRDATKAENQQNRGLNRDNKSGFMGVHRRKDTGKWAAQIGIGGKKKHIGFFDNPAEAHAAYLSVKRAEHKFNPVPRSTVKIAMEDADKRQKRAAKDDVLSVYLASLGIA